MSFNGVYNIKLNNGNANANSCAVGPASLGVNLIQFNGSDPTQKWTIRPIGGVGPNFYTIQNATGLYVIPQTDHLAYGTTPYAWRINGTSGLITTTSPTTLNWLPSDNGQFVIITANSSWTWTVSPAS